MQIKFTIVILAVGLSLYANAVTTPQIDLDASKVPNIASGEVLRVQGTGKEAYIPVIRDFAEKYKVSPAEIERIIDCENEEYDPKLQSRIRYTEGQISRHPDWGIVGEREKSFGLVQIHLPAGNKWKGKTITKEQATDPIFSIEFLAYQLSKGNGPMWSCY